MQERHAATILITTWFLAVTITLGVAARGVTKAILVRSVGIDDYLVTASFLLAIGQSIAMSLETKYGFATSRDPPRTSAVTVSLKSQYAAGILYVASVSFAKGSVLALVNSLSPIRAHRRATVGIACFIGIWAIANAVGTAFICRLPHPWNYMERFCSKSSIRRDWWNYFESTNIATDVALILLPLVMIWKLKISTSRKVAAGSFFALRSSIIAASTCKLVFWNTTSDLQKSDHDPFNVILCTQVIQCLSLMSACSLYLKPFLVSLESGFIRHDDIRRRGTDHYYGHASGEPSSMRSGLSTKRRERQDHQSLELLNHPSPLPPTHTAMAIAIDDPGFESESHQNDPQQIINQTKTFTVERELNRRSKI